MASTPRLLKYKARAMLSVTTEAVSCCREISGVKSTT